MRKSASWAVLSCDPSKMASRIWVLHRRGFVLSPPCALSQYRRSSTGPGASSWKGQFTQFLSSYFTGFKELSVKNKNAPYTKTRKQYGKDFAAAVFAVQLKGKVKFQGQEEWFFRRIWELDPELCLEGVDVRGSLINYDGLKNLVILDNLRYLNLSQCPYIDDWCLSQLYNLSGCLEELSLAGCHQVTEKGLACLHHLENLRRLDVSDLPGVIPKELVRILLEEMLPQCSIAGMEIETLEKVYLDLNGKAPRGLEA